MFDGSQSERIPHYIFMKTTQQLWEERSQKYKSAIEGVLPKSLPRVLNNYLDQWMYENIKREIDFNKHLKILDIGCGYGRLSEKILKDFPKVNTFGIDVAEQYIDLYNQRLSPKGSAAKGDMKKLRFPSKEFDVVFLVTTLMYMVTEDDQQKALRELFRVLKPGGRFIIIERGTLGNNIFTLAGLITKLRGKKSKEIPAVSF